MAKLNYTECKKLINDIHNDTYNKDQISELLKLNRYTLQDFTTAICKQAFYIKGISSITHATNLSNDIKKCKLSEYETEILLSINDISCTEEALFELEKVNRRKDLYKKYNDLLKEAQANCFQCARIDSMHIDFLKLLQNNVEIGKLRKERKELEKRLNEELEELEKGRYKA